MISAIGKNQTEMLSSLQESRSGIAAPVYLKTTHLEFPLGEVKATNEELAALLHRPVTQAVSRTALLGMVAVQEALTDARLDGSQRIAFISGTTVAGMDQTECYYPDTLSADMICQHPCGNSTNSIADHFGCFDYTTTASTACSSALNAIILGKLLIESGRYDIVVAGGTESLSKFHLNGFKSLLILDEQPCRPFDKTRAGLNLGEGAAYVVLESETSVKQRNIHPRFILEGAGNACDAFHSTASSEHGDGAYLAMSQALTDAHLLPQDIDYINAHGTATPNNDTSESEAIRRVFGEAIPPVSSTKGLTGHTTSASGSIECVCCMLALAHQFIPLNANWQEADENCIIPFTDDKNQTAHDLRHVMCNAFGFGGNDSSIIIGTYHE